MGARAKKGLPTDLVEDAMEDDEVEAMQSDTRELLEELPTALTLDGEGDLFQDLGRAESEEITDVTPPLFSSTASGGGD